MGTGKTSWAIQEMIANPEESYIYCTPFLDEVRRIKEKCEPQRKFYDPQRIDGKKIEGFNHLLESGKDIVLTHSTFSNANQETLENLTQGNYCLILDEVLDILVKFNDVAQRTLDKGDPAVLIREKFVSVDDYNHQWDDFLCVRNNGDLLRPGYVTQTFPQLCEKCGLRKIKLHELRHTNISLLHSGGASLKEIQTWAGHSNFGTTVAVYTHVMDQSKTKLTNTISSILRQDAC